MKIIKDIYPDASTVDLGCGRSEWLELLNANQIDAVGVDTNYDMVNFHNPLIIKPQTRYIAEHFYMKIQE